MGANQYLKLAEYKKTSTNINPMTCNHEPSARREGVLRGRVVLRAATQNSMLAGGKHTIIYGSEAGAAAVSASP